jgi:hypothetical protein
VDDFSLPDGPGLARVYSIYLILPAVLGPGLYSASNRNEYQRNAGNLTTIFEATVWTTWDPEHLTTI